MTNYVLQITLLSPLTSSSGEGRVGIVDRDIAFDDLGLPIIPGKRLKGLWRAAYNDVVDAWRLCGDDPIPVTDIFGETGQKPDDGDACIYVANAQLPEAPSLREWLEYLQHHHIRNLHPDDVVQHFATVRAQTAIDRRTGAAREDTLRLTRTLRSGWVFHAPVRLLVPSSEELHNALALGAAALQYMGTARTRGLGRVCCRLLGPDARGEERDLTERALNQGSLPSITVSKSSQLPQTPMWQTSHLNKGTPTHLLRYRLTLTAPVIIPVADGDPNSVVTRQEVPGSNIWGAAAWHYLRQTGNTPEETEGFCHAFLDGNLRFLTAYPETCNLKENEKPQRMIPIPHSIREFKNTRNLVDFLKQPPEDLEVPVKRLDRRYARIYQGGLETQDVKTERNYHHARANDRSKGRALGGEVPNGGAFFSYEAIKADQSFQGAILGSKDDLENLQEWLKKVDSIKLGRSRSAQYGNAAFQWIDNKPQDLGQTNEWNGFRKSVSDEVDSESFGWLDEGPQELDQVSERSEADEALVSDEVDSEGFGWLDEGPQELNQVSEQSGSDELECDTANHAKHLIITTLSPMLTVNDYGHPEARFPERELAQVLGPRTSKLILLHSYTRTELIGGYNAQLRLPRQQWPVIAAGSVFVFKLSPELNKECEEWLVKRLEHDGLGLRKGEGYGRLAVNRQDKFGLTDEQEIRLDDPDRQRKPDLPNLDMPQKVKELLQDVRERFA